MKRGATKEYVLNMLEQNKGNYITGMKVAEDLGITRNAVWKAINELKKEGYTIHSVSRRGYALDESSYILSAAAIKKRLFELSREIDVADRELLETSINVVADNIIIFDCKALFALHVPKARIIRKAASFLHQPRKGRLH